jgi:uncharacterized protein (TIGR00730 family)
LTFSPAVIHKADEAFSQARRRAFFQRIWNALTGHHRDNLLSFDEVRDKLRVRGQHYAGIQTIPIAKIAGSVGRYQEFNHAFLPTQEHIRKRWKRVYQVAHEQGFPPIEVYKIGDVYFVRDGHHRVSVLKDLGATTIEAAVTELDTPIHLSPDVDEEALALKEEYAIFLAEAGLDRLQPDQEIEFTLPGQYQKLLEHIAVHRHFLGLQEQREIPHSEAVSRWYNDVYAPLVQAIREEGILDDFSGRTEADLYLWIVEHRHYLGERYDQEIPLAEAAADFSREFGTGAGKKQLEAEVKKAKGGARKRDRDGRRIAVFGSGSAPPDHEVLAQAERLGQLLAEAGFVLVCGGYGGTMEAASRGAHRAGGQVIGVTMDLFSPRLTPNPWLTREQRVKDFLPRLKRLMAVDGFVILRGGIGTLTEATLAWTLLQTRQISPRPFVFVGDQWRRLFDAFRAETFMTDRDFALSTVVDNVDEALAALKDTLAPTP